MHRILLQETREVVRYLVPHLTSLISPQGRTAQKGHQPTQVLIT